MALFHTHLTVGSIQLLISFFQRAPWFTLSNEIIFLHWRLHLHRRRHRRSRRCRHCCCCGRRCCSGRDAHADANRDLPPPSSPTQFGAHLQKASFYFKFAPQRSSLSERKRKKQRTNDIKQPRMSNSKRCHFYDYLLSVCVSVLLLSLSVFIASSHLQRGASSKRVVVLVDVCYQSGSNENNWKLKFR